LPSRFSELATAVISDTRHVVVSSNVEGKYSVAQKMLFNAEGKDQYMFMKNSIIVDKAGLIELQRAINEAVAKAR